MKKIACFVLVLCITLGTALCLSSCKKDDRSKVAEFPHVGLKYSFEIPKNLGCVVDNNDKEVIWLHDKKNAADWKIIITLMPATEDEFKNFDMNQRSLIKSNKSETIAEGVFLYDYDAYEEAAAIYSIAYYDKAAECIVFLKATDDIELSVSKELILNGAVSKTKKK